MTKVEGRGLKWSLSLAASSVLSALGLLFLSQTEAINAATTYLLFIIPLGLMITAFVLRPRGAASGVKPSHVYIGRVALCMMFYLMTLFMAEHLIEDRGLGGWMAAILAALPGLSFAGLVWVYGALIVEEKDEFLRMLHVRQGLIATGIALTLAAVWGFLETYYIVDHVAAFWWPTIWCMGFLVGGLANIIKYGTAGAAQ